jgi:hypothetical protein
MTEPSLPIASLGTVPMGDRGVELAAVRPSAYAAPAQFLALPQGQELDALAQLAQQVLADPLAVQRLSDRVVELMRQDLRQQRERSGSYGRRG